MVHFQTILYLWQPLFSITIIMIITIVIVIIMTIATT